MSCVQDSSATDTSMGVFHADPASGRQGKHSAWVGADASVMAAVCLQQAERADLLRVHTLCVSSGCLLE